tara:strand:- start:1477 stop:2190 length:714 start_codon:yes stop_codon:yes gene_type:complete
MNFRQIFLGILIVLILYLVYTYIFRDSTSSNLYKGGNAKQAQVIDPKKLPGNKGSVDFTFSIWIYVNSWQYRYGSEKTIFRRISKKGNDVMPEVALAASTNDLKITLTHYPKEGIDDVGQTDSWMVHNIPLQKWCNILLSTNNRAVDTYIDGKLVNTHVLAGVPKTDAEAPVLLTPDDGFSGETSKFRYIARSINPREAYEIYREGPGGNWLTDLLSQYKLKFSFLKNNEEVNSFEI